MVSIMLTVPEVEDGIALPLIGRGLNPAASTSPATGATAGLAESTTKKSR